jgi:glycosyltransferase involved in cell wall biosynthesis
MKNTGKDDRITVMNLIGSLQVGGAEQQVVSLAPMFDKRKFKVVVCAMQPGGALRDRLDQAGIEYICINYRIRSYIPTMLRFISLLKREKVDVLHMHMYTAARFGRIAGLLAGVPVMVTTDHGHDPWKRWWHIAFDRVLLRYTDLRIGVSQDVADAIRGCENPPPEKLAMIPNGVDPAKFEVPATERTRVRTELGITDDVPLVGAVGRFVEPKAFHVLIEAIAKLAATRPDVRLVLVGDGPLRAELERCAADLGVSDRVIFAGMRMDVPSVLAALDVFAMSSISEGLPVVLLEAMASAKPIVVTRVGGIPEVVSDHEDALLVAPNNPLELATAIGALLADHALADRLGKQARTKVVAHYSVAASVRNLERVYQELLAKCKDKQGT